jgi:hypothetical protein
MWDDGKNCNLLVSYTGTEYRVGVKLLGENTSFIEQLKYPNSLNNFTSNQLKN